MADPIPAADAALLAAQAKAGQAGVDAYKAAQTTLQTQRQGAVDMAMREAALRGAPTGAMESQVSTMTQPYDQRIASLAQGQAAFQGDMAARDRRMTDYNAAVNAARSYIPQQTEQAVAPIRARGEYEVRQQQIAGDRSVSEINANLRLTEAKMAAAFQAAMIKAAQDAAKEAAKGRGGGAGKLNQGELQSMLSAGGLERVGRAAQTVKDLTAANRAKAVSESQAGMRAATAAGRAKLTPEQQRAQQRENTAAESAFAFNRGMGRSTAVTSRAVGQAIARSAGPTRSGWDAFKGALNGGITGGSQGSPWDVFDNLGKQAALPTASQLAAQAAEARAERERINQETNQQRNSVLQTTFDKYRSPVGYITPDQLSMFDPVDASFLVNSPAFLANDRDVDRYLLGAPYASKQFQGQSDPYSVQVMRDALAAAGDDLLGQGYEFDYPQFMNAIGNKGQSYFNARAEEMGQDNTEDIYKRQVSERKDAESAAEDAARDAEREDEDAWGDLWNDRRNAEWLNTHDPKTGLPLPTAKNGEDARQAKIRQEFESVYNMGPPSGMSLDSAYAATQTDEYSAAEDYITNDASFGKGFLTPDEFNTAVATLAQGGTRLSAGARRLLQHFYVHSVSEDWEAPVPLEVED